jgi:RNA polymerase sigma-70 factor (ECF subfamily)
MLPETEQLDTAEQPSQAGGAGKNSRPASLRILPDEDLMVLMAQGIVEGPIAELFRRHNRALFNFIAWSCQGNLEQAEQICQKTWAKLMKVPDYQSNGLPLRAFIYQLARASLIEAQVITAPAMAEVEEELAAPEDDLSPEKELNLKRNVSKVRQALMDLPSWQREVVVLRFFSDLSLDEIASSIGVGFETVKNRLRFAFSNLRTNLEHAE